MGCVNTSSREFKALAAKNNVDANVLELITHKYWIERGSEDLFPTDVYIQAQLGKTQYQEKGKSVRKLWKKSYSTPRTFASMPALQRAQNEALKFFPPSALVHYKDAKGEYVLTVRQPVERVNHSAADFFENSFPNNVGKIDLGLDSNEVYTLDKVQELYDRFNTDRRSKQLAEKVFGIAKDLGLKITFNESLGFNNFGRYTNDNTIVFKKSFFERDWMNNLKAPILLHEVIHALTMYAVSNQTKNWKKPEQIEQFTTEINSIFQDVRNHEALKGERGITDLKEFIAELANPIFRQKLQSIDKKNIWQRVLDAVKNFLGIRTESTYYNRAMNALDEALNAFDLDLYLRYNGVRNLLKEGYIASDWEFGNSTIEDVRLNIEKDLINNLPGATSQGTIVKNPELTEEEKQSLDRLKPQYRGKLIYAQAGTGKSTIADNIAVFDSDYLLGEILGTSTDTAGFFFKTLSSEQKTAFGEQYRNLIKQKVKEGKTVLTANASLLPEAEVVIYNESPELTDERVNNIDRAINNQYSALDYHKATLEQIQQLQQNEKDKEYISLNNSSYIGNYILSDNTLVNLENKRREANGSRPGLGLNAFTKNFLQEFGIAIDHLNNYDNDVPLFEALDRCINARTSDDITEGIGYAVAFMMQADPEMQKIIMKSHGLEGNYNTKIRDPRKLLLRKSTMGQMTRMLLLKDSVIREVGNQIAQELRKHFGEDINQIKPSQQKVSVWNIIKNFFNKIRIAAIRGFWSKGNVIRANTLRKEAKEEEKVFVRDVIEALGKEDYSRIKGPMVKPKTSEKAQRVSIEQALGEHPFEENIISKLNTKGIALAGSASIALEGTLFRPTENPLHDIDFNAGNKSSKASMDKIMSELFEKGTWVFSSSIRDILSPLNSTQTYVILNQPFITKNVKNKGFYAEYYSPSGEYLGKRVVAELHLEPGVQGKLLDFFVGPKQESKYSFYKTKLNGKEYLISNSKAAMAAKILWARPKDMWDYKNFVRNDYKTDNLLAQLDLIDGMSDAQLQEQMQHIQQEYADYELVNGKEETPKGKSQHTGPQPFTFKDGTTINAPFKPNAQQADALNTMDEFIHSDETSMTLSGYAGTGKTSLMEMLAKKMQKEHKHIVFSATTNKAAAVLKSRVARSGFDAYTLNKVFGISVEVDSNKAYNARNLVNVIKESELVQPGDVVVIDEASMINEENYKILNQIAEQNGLKIIYVGDKAQLAPVNETQVSKVFRNGEGTVIELTQVERTDDNAILKEATAIRNGKRLSGESSFNEKGEGVAYIPKDNKKAIGDVVRHYVQGLQNDPNFFRILAYTNDAVTKYNEAVRKTLGYEGNIPHVSEPMTGYANWGYDYRTKSYRFINSESYKVTKVGNPKTVSIDIDGQTVHMTAVPLTLEDSMGNKDTFDFMDIKGNQENRQAATILAKEKSKLWEAARRAVGREAKAKIYQQINAIDSFLFVNDNITEGNRFLQTKTIDFGYALTIHKSQGSTFTHVLMDDVDVQKANTTGNSMENAMAAVDLGEIGQDANNAELRSSEEVDLGDLSSVPTETIAPNQNLANVRQQLEYVGVSRATDTVTIISNNVKKEDSSLNHIDGKDVKSEHQNEINVEENRFNNKDEQIVTVAPYFRQSLTTQNKEELEKATQEVKQKAEKLARAIGLEISDVEVVGGTYLGSSEITYQYHIKSTDSEKVDLFASLMGDLSFEYQDAVIAANYTKDRKQATAIEVTYKVPENTKIEDVEKKLNEVGIDGSTLHFDSNELSIMAFNQEEYEDIVNKLENTDYEFKEFTLQNSRYLDNESRRNTYEAWNNSERGKQNRQLSNACSKALAICEAAAKFQETNQESERLAAAQQAAKDWDDTHGITQSSAPSEATTHMNEVDDAHPFVSYPLLMENLGKETGERLIQVDAEWKEQELKNLDRDLGQAQDSAIKEAIINNIYEVAHAKERISLPNYEYFTDKYEDTLVDAEWKIPMLEELDAKISTEKDEEFNTTIINQMNAVLQAKSEEEYHSAPKAQETVQQNLSEFDKLTTQINNLLDSNEITASEIRHIAELVVNSISDAITDIQKGTLNPEEEFIGFSTDKDMQNVSRREIVEAVGINRLIDRAKNNFDPENADYEDLDTIMQAELITNNWDAIMTLASDIFAANEGFGIGKDYSKGGFQMVNNITQEFDSFNIHEDTESIEETEGDEQEHWQIESRTIDVLNSMSALVRQALHECYQLDKNGNKIVSKWGIAERVNPRKTVNSILRWTQGSLSLEDMVKKLSDKATQNPWLTQLIERLSDTSGKETDFQSQFYGVFSKHFQPYSIVLLEDGKYASIPVNSHPALSEAMNTITTQYKVGSHALFTNNGINKKLLGTENTTYPEADFNLHKALASLSTIMDRLNHGENLDESMAENASANIMGVCRIMGYPVAEDMLQDAINKENLQKMTHALGFIVKSLDAALQAQQRGEKYNPFAFGTDNNIGGTLRNFLTPITEQLEDTAVNAFYDSGKMYQSYVTPSFMTKLMNKFRLEGQEFEDFIMNEYGNSEWFKFSGGRFNTGWRNEWLRLLATDENARKVFDHKVELNFNKHNYMRNMSDAEYTLSLITEYFAETAQKGQTMVPAWFRIPMLSNKPSSEFIKFYSYRGSTYKDEIVNGLYNMFLQELSRIQTVKMRGHDKNDAEFIKNFDSNGRKFNFLPFLNEYLEGKRGTILRNADNTVSEENARLSYLLQKKADGYEALTSDEEAALTTLAEKAIRAYMENRVQSILDKWQNDGILEAAKAIKGIGEEEEIIRSNIENFLWNDAFASKNILQLTITDIAFYKDAEDLQKRLAQLHAPGTRGNVAATDYEGNRVSDGTYRTFILQDFDNFKSNIIANIAEVFDKKIAAAPENQKAGLKALKESLVGENGKYTKINVADAQGYSSPASYRKKAFIFGRWSRQAEDIYQKLKKDEYNYTDLETAFQPLKPFVYSHLQKNMGVENAPIHSMPVPFQAKNAEYLLIMADAILQGEELSRPNLLRAVYRVMEESERLNPTKGIDTVQFESAIKSGLQGRINIHQFANIAGGEEAAFTFMMSQLYKQNADGTRSTQYNTDTFVHEASFEDYCLQQEVPAHFKEHAQAHGSQIRMIVPSDLDLYKNSNGDLSAEDNQVYYEWTEPDGTKKKVKANDFKKEYEQTIAENIAESINDLAAELHFNSQDKKERNIALSKILQREILSSPRYGVDLIQACSVDKETGEFRIPKGDPIQSKRIEQLINSIIKNRVNKQKIAGGPIVQVSNFGTSRQLHIRFNDKNGNLLMTEEEFKTSGKDGTYNQYVKENQAGIAYFEVFIPLFSKELFDKFSNYDGTINVEAIEATDPELLKMVSYRIPTEDKYSMAPMKVVGFMPKEAGDAIMLPYELTEIDDSDFDVDKRYVMRKDIPIKKRSRKEIEEKLFKQLSESYSKAHEGKTANRFIADQLRMFLDNPEKMRHTDALMESLYREYQKVAYYTVAPTSGRKYRDNKIVDMTLAVLTNEMTADKILNPGGFDAPKKMGYMVAAYKNPANRGLSWEQLQKISIDELKDLSYTDKDLTWADTQVQFYRQNSAAASLIGVFAVNKVAHATLEGNDIFVAVDEICGEQPFTIIDTEFGYRMPVDAMHDNKGNLIGKTLGSLVSASADAVKDPILNLMNINMTTAGMLNTMLRLGMTFDDAALFLSQDIIERALNEFNKQNLTNYEPLSNIIEDWLQDYREKNSISDDSNINTEPLTKEELIEGLRPGVEHGVIDYKVLLAFQKLRKLVDAMRKPTFATRFNSISSAVGPLIIDNLIIEHKMEQFMDSNSEEGTHFYTSDNITVDIDDIFYDHPILRQFARTVDVAKQMFYDMPSGSIGFRNLLATMPDGMADKLFNDKKLLDQLSNFYQSYLLVQSGMINPSQLKNYIEGFPKWFMDQNFKEKYPENALIQAIKMNVSKRTGRPYLMVNITGMDTQQKEELGNAWIDLHKTNLDLSQKLFTYSFFRAGVGFSPKTFMSLVPTYVKERLETTTSTGKASYVDTYRRFPSVNSALVIDQFIRNNWDNNKLVPKKGGEGTKYIVDLNRGTLIVRDAKDMADLQGVIYMKTRHNGQTYLWKLLGKEEDNIRERYYVRVKPLGNNGEYLEMSLENIQNSLSETTQTVEDMDAAETTEIKETAPAEAETSEATGEIVSESEKSQRISNLADAIMKQRKIVGKPINKTEATNQIEKMKRKPEMFGEYMVNVFKQMGLDLSKEEAIKEFKKLC